MTKRSLLAVLVILIIVSPISGQNTSLRRIYLHSDPMFAQIILDGSVLPRLTPAVIEVSANQEHEIRVQKAGFEEQILQVDAPEDDDGPASLGVRLVLNPEEVVAGFSGVEGLRTAEGERDSETFRLETPEGEYRISREESLLEISRVYPRESLRRALGLAFPLVLTTAALSLVQDGQSAVYPVGLTPTSLLLNGAALAVGVGAVALNVEKYRYEQTQLRYIPRRNAPGAAAELFRQGESALRFGGLDEALRAYQQLLDEYPESGYVPATMRKIGEIYRIYRRPETARRFFDTVLRRYPDPDEINLSLLALAELDTLSGAYQAALGHLDAVHPPLGGVTEKQVTLQRLAVLESRLAEGAGHEEDPQRIAEAYRDLIRLSADDRERSRYQRRLEALGL